MEKDNVYEARMAVAKGARVVVMAPFNSNYVVIWWTGPCGAQETVELTSDDARILSTWLKQAASFTN